MCTAWCALKTSWVSSKGNALLHGSILTMRTGNTSYCGSILQDALPDSMPAIRRTAREKEQLVNVAFDKRWVINYVKEVRGQVLYKSPRWTGNATCDLSPDPHVAMCLHFEFTTCLHWSCWRCHRPENWSCMGISIGSSLEVGWSVLCSGVR